MRHCCLFQFQSGSHRCGTGYTWRHAGSHHGGYHCREDLPGAATQQFATVTLLIVSTTLLTGLLLLTLGYFKLGGIVRFLPYPVIGGFLAGSGWLLVQGGIGLMADTPIGLGWFQVGDLNAMAPRSVTWNYQPYRFAKSPKAVRDFAFDVDGFVIVLCLHMDDEALDGRFARRRLVIGLARLFLDLGIPTRSKLSLTSELVRAPGTTADHHPDRHDLRDRAPLKFQRYRIADQKRSRPELRVDGGRLRQSLRRSGWRTGRSSGYQLFDSLNHVMTGGKRMVGILVALMIAATLFVGTSAILYIPKFVFGAVLIYLGIELLMDWVYEAWFKIFAH